MAVITFSWGAESVYFLSLPLPGLGYQEGLVIGSGATKCWALGTPGRLPRRPGASLQPQRTGVRKVPGQWICSCFLRRGGEPPGCRESAGHPSSYLEEMETAFSSEDRTRENAVGRVCVRSPEGLPNLPELCILYVSPGCCQRSGVARQAESYQRDDDEGGEVVTSTEDVAETVTENHAQSSP